jgi:hypothetical protein
MAWSLEGIYREDRDFSEWIVPERKGVSKTSNDNPTIKGGQDQSAKIEK